MFAFNRGPPLRVAPTTIATMNSLPKFGELVRLQRNGRTYWLCPCCELACRGQQARDYSRHLQTCPCAPWRLGPGSDDEGDDPVDMEDDGALQAAPVHEQQAQDIGADGQEDAPLDYAASPCAEGEGDLGQQAGVGELEVHHVVHVGGGPGPAAGDAQLAAFMEDFQAAVADAGAAAASSPGAHDGEGDGHCDGSTGSDDGSDGGEETSDGTSDASSGSDSQQEQLDYDNPAQIPQFDNHGEWFRQHAADPLYPATAEPASMNVMQTTLQLNSWKQQHHIGTKAYDALLALLADGVLPEGNRLPRSEKLCRRALNQGEAAEYEWHVCSCERHAWAPLPKQEWEAHSEDACPHCEGPRFIRETTTGGRDHLAPAKVSDIGLLPVGSHAVSRRGG